MTTYVAHYQSPAAADVRGSGTFTFESEGKAGSKTNLRDARLKMLELFGRDAVSWTIERVEKKKANNTISDGQMTLDFRPPKAERKRAVRKDWW
ncbi:hypothetical protein [Adlercreutzia aquisgranensis]|uniref:hypothetical protein n=1 Tax=Adlercreutzia aquisgranensis TaxID=2941323 RepID=UPI00203E9C72|nr:hypothetical protein [Adlercreutzia aquisgranensis]